MSDKLLIKQGLGYFLLFLELNAVRNEKIEAVKAQDYLQASELREEEKRLQDMLPTFEDLKDLYNKL